MSRKSREGGALSSGLPERFGARIDALRDARSTAQARIDAGALPSFPDGSRDVREGEWQARASAPPHEAVTCLDFGSVQTCTEVVAHAELRQVHTREEAALWAELFAFIEEQCAAAPGTTRVTLVVDTIQAAFELDEILYELRDRAVALRWDREAYLLSFVRAFHAYPEYVLPDPSELAIGAPFLRALGKHALHIGTQRGIDVAGFPAPPTDSPNPVEGADLLQIHVGKITAQGVRENLDIALRHLEAGEAGNAGAELALAQLWQWAHHATGVLDEGQKVDEAMLEKLIGEEAHGEAVGRLMRWLREPDAVFGRRSPGLTGFVPI